MAYTLKSSEELQHELYLEVKDFVTKFSYQNRNIDEDNYFQTISQILVEAERIEQYYEEIGIISKIEQEQ